VDLNFKQIKCIKFDTVYFYHVYLKYYKIIANIIKLYQICIIFKLNIFQLKSS
jgi:hypothetical protein